MLPPPRGREGVTLAGFPITQDTRDFSRKKNSEPTNRERSTLQITF